MKELYAFEKYCGYTLVVEFVEDDEDKLLYEGIAYTDSPNNTEIIVKCPSGSKCLDRLIELVDYRLDPRSHIW